MSLGRLCGRLRERPCNAGGSKVAYTIKRLNPLLRGWASYFKLS